MKQSMRMILTLVIIASISGAVLAKVYNMTKSKIEVQQQKRTEEAIFSVVPNTKTYKSKSYDSIKVFRCFDKNNKLSGVAFTTEGTGYQGVIKLMVGLNRDLTEITGIKILKDEETPGLGARINEDWFQNQFESKATDIELKIIRGEPKKADQIQAITGATISSEAVIDIVNKKVKKVKQALNE